MLYFFDFSKSYLIIVDVDIEVRNVRGMLNFRKYG